MNTFSRRDFIKSSSALAAGAALLPNFELFKEEKPIGIQLWSVKDDMKNDPEATLETIAKIGYNYVEGFGYDKGKFFGKTPVEFKKLLKDLGMKMPAAHSVVTGKHYDAAKKDFTDEFKKAVEDAAKVGQRYFISPWTAAEDRKDADTYKQFCDILNKAGEYCKTVNLRFGYHNHDFEFKKLGDEMIYETLLKNTDPTLVTMEMDIYWVVFAGQDPVEWFKKYPRRFELAHIKDMVDDETKDSTPVGLGKVDFDAVLENAKKGGLKMYVVELEHYLSEPLADVKTCYKNFRKILRSYE